MSVAQREVARQTSADLRLFASDSAVPWFKPERLTEPNFSAEAYVADLRRYVPLETLAEELDKYLGTLRGKLVEVINEDYNDFVSLTTKLVNVDGAVKRMAGPLQEISQQLGSVEGSLQSELDALQDGLRMRQETAADRALLELMQDTAHTMTKVESLLSEIELLDDEEAAALPDVLDRRSRMLERLASEVSRLSFYAAKGKVSHPKHHTRIQRYKFTSRLERSSEVLDSKIKQLKRSAQKHLGGIYFAQDLPFTQSLEARMASAKEKLQFRLSATLKAALVESQASARHHCILAYAAISDAHGAEQAVQDAICRPLVALILEQHPSTGPRPAEVFPKVLEQVLERVKPQMGPLLEGTSGSESGLQNFNFLGNSLLAEVDKAVAEKLSSKLFAIRPSTLASIPWRDKSKESLSCIKSVTARVFEAAFLGAISPGVPTTFLSNYKAAVDFLEGLESNCTSSTALAAFRSCAPYVSFNKRWKLSIYFSTRFQEIAGALENSISGGEQIKAESSGDRKSRLALAPSVALQECLKRSLSPDVFLRPLADKFSRLALQLLARYTSWLKLGSAASEQQGAPPPVSEEQAEGRWGSNTPIDLAACARADIDSLHSWLRADFLHSFREELAFLPPEASAAAVQALEQSIEGVKLQAHPLAAKMVSELADNCSTGLSQLRGIVAMYRMSARPSPTRPSHYMAGILNSLAEFLQSPVAQGLQAEARQELAQGVVSEISERLQKMLSELLETLRKTESSLKRIRQSRATEVATGGGPSDIDKISLQLFLDVQEFGRQAAKFGVEAASLPSFQNLWKTAAPSDKADSIQF